MGRGMHLGGTGLEADYKLSTIPKKRHGRGEESTYFNLLSIV